jgi:hypothetical protein
VRRLLALLILAAVAVVGVARAGDAPLSLSGGAKQRSLTFTRSGPSETATLTLIVQNAGASGGTLAARFVEQSGAVAKITEQATTVAIPRSGTKATPPAPALENPKALTVRLLQPTTLVVAAHDAAQLQIEFHRDVKAAQGNAVRGHLVISLDNDASDPIAGPVVVGVTISKNAPAVTKLKFAQDKATISLTRLLGPFGGAVPKCTKCLLGESVHVGTRGERPTSAEATINSESGGSATVKLKRSDGSSSKLRVTSLDRHGSYEGKLVLDPDAAKPRSLTVAVKARDFILWPLLAILLGGLLGALLLQKHEVSRNRGLVQAMIQDSVNPYVDARARADGKAERPDRFYLEALLPEEGSPYPTGTPCQGADSLKAVPRLYCKAAKLDGDQSLADLLPEVTDVTARFDRWHKVEDAISALSSAITSLPPGAAYAPMRDDAATITIRGNLEPDDDKAASELVLLMHAEAAAAAAYAHARELFDKQLPAWRSTHTNVDPDHDLAGFDPPVKRTAANAELVALALLYKVALLQHPERIPPDAQPDEQGAYVEELIESVGSRVATRYLSPTRESIIIAARAVPPDNVDTRTPEQIRAQVRKSDWMIFWLTAVLTALVYLAGKYTADWGSWEDYLFAFAAGAVAPSVITWSLIPYARSYRAQAQAVPAAADG